MTNRVNTIVTDALMLVGGSVVGAGVALLLAPQSGAKSRREIVRFGRSMGKKGERAFRNISDSVSDFAETVGGKAGLVLHKW